MLTFSPNLIVFTAALTFDVISMTGNSVSFCSLPLIGVYGPLSSLIPDLIPEQQRGVASGFQQLFQNLGSVTGSILGLFGTDLGTVPSMHPYQGYY